MNHSVLIVDDEPSIRKVLELVFKAEYTVITRNDGLEAMEWLENGNSADLVIIDINMPNLNGLEFTKAVRSSNLLKDLPIIILSSLDTSGDRIRCLELGADDYIVKPFNPQEVKLRVKTILRRVNHGQVVK